MEVGQTIHGRIGGAGEGIFPVRRIFLEQQILFKKKKGPLDA